VSNYASALSKTEQAKIFGDNALRFYQRASF
jgi:predicted TIM-barrel fold metal-dependent hydrolase